MMKYTAIAIAIVVLAGLVCSSAWSQDNKGTIWLGGYYLLRVRTGAGGYSLEQRVNEIQARANNLLQLGKTVSEFSVRKSGRDANIYADNELFMTVSPADAAANGTTVLGLADVWAKRLQTIYPDARTKTPTLQPMAAPADNG